MLVVLPGLYFSRVVWKMYGQPRPAEPPEESKAFWPMWFVAAAFYHNRAYGLLFLLGLALQLALSK
jgi:1,4-dihydroxy-2-naphthoate octaprenyltransferase